MSFAEECWAVTANHIVALQNVWHDDAQHAIGISVYKVI